MGGGAQDTTGAPALLTDDISLRQKFFILLAMLLSAGRTQGADTVRVAPVKLPPVLQSPLRQFSGMALHDRVLYLLPENRTDKPGSDGIYSLPLAEILAVLADTSRSPDEQAVRKYDLEGMDYVFSLPGYEGLEALDILGDEFFMTVETDTTSSFGYIIKGKIRDGVFRVTPVSLPLKKITGPGGNQFFNAGFESLQLIGGKLLCLYEYNYDGAGYAYLADTSLRIPAEKIFFEKKVPFRITDIEKLDASAFLALNYFFRLKAEGYYAEGLDQDDERWITGVDGAPHPSFARILEIRETAAGRLSVERSWVLPQSLWGINWEGMARLPGRGVLLINDLYMGKQRASCMMFVELPGIEN